MLEPFKRTFTEGDKVAFAQLDAPNNADTPPDLATRLRNVGSRVRKSVTEGYITPPSSRVLVKAQSTTTIFASAKDINRDVFSSNATPREPSQPHKKRSRSVSDTGSETEPEDNNHMVLGNQTSTSITNPQGVEGKANRVIKPLRKHRGLMETYSLPAGALRFSHRPDVALASTMESEEADWSVQPSDKLDRTSFEPVVFD